MSSSDIQSAILDAWPGVWEKLQHDPLRLRGGQADELANRLARRRRAVLTRPPRAFCLAVRASDNRINPATACISPQDAVYPRSHVSPEMRGQFRYREHSVTLDAKLLRKICRPVTITPPGQDWTQGAAMLGVHKCGLYYVMSVDVRNPETARRFPMGRTGFKLNTRLCAMRLRSVGVGNMS